MVFENLGVLPIVITYYQFQVYLNVLDISKLFSNILTILSIVWNLLEYSGNFNKVCLIFWQIQNGLEYFKFSNRYVLNELECSKIGECLYLMYTIYRKLNEILVIQNLLEYC